MMTPERKMADPDVPREATTAEIAGLVEAFAQAARNAVEAGCDGVELHGANGYLLHQFFSERSNRRTDRYGGTASNRIRFPLEAAEAAVAAIGPERVGIRISPLAAYQDARVGDPEAIYPALLAELNRLNLAYVHCVEGEPGKADGAPDADFDFPALRRQFRGAWIANNGYDAPRAAERIAAGDADLVSFGRPFIANPDLPERIRLGAPLNPINQTNMYAGRREEGYTDYPALELAG
jgi:N-ethylmaleimide reductase